MQPRYGGREVGNVRAGYVGNDPTQEILELVRIVNRKADEMASARAEVPAPEERAHAYAAPRPAYPRPA